MSKDKFELFEEMKEEIFHRRIGNIVVKIQLSIREMCDIDDIRPSMQDDDQMVLPNLPKKFNEDG
jgi:hypothetical protein